MNVGQIVLTAFLTDADDGFSATSFRDCYATVQKNGVSGVLLFTLLALTCGAHFRPRVILVEDHGVLVGLVTVKDVLRFRAMEKPESYPSWDERGDLDGILEQIWTTTTSLWSTVVRWSRRA